MMDLCLMVLDLSVEVKSEVGGIRPILIVLVITFMGVHTCLVANIFGTYFSVYMLQFLSMYVDCQRLQCHSDFIVFYTVVMFRAL